MGNYDGRHHDIGGHRPDVERRRCAYCGEKIRVLYGHHWPEGLRGQKFYDGTHQLRGYPWSNPIFCRTDCAITFAVSCHSVGVAVVRRPGQGNLVSLPEAGLTATKAER